MNPLNPSESEICVLSTSYWLNQRFEDWPWWGSCHVASTSLRVKLAKIKSQTLGSEILTLNKGETKWHLVTPTLAISLWSCMDGFESFALWRYNGCISYFVTASFVNCHDSVFLTFSCHIGWISWDISSEFFFSLSQVSNWRYGFLVKNGLLPRFNQPDPLVLRLWPRRTFCLTWTRKGNV